MKRPSVQRGRYHSTPSRKTGCRGYTGQVRETRLGTITPPPTPALEASYTRNWEKWGGALHYTFTLSRPTQTETKWKTRTDLQNPASDIVTISRDETRPLEGQSKHLGGLSIWYKDPRSCTAQVSFVYTAGARISDVSGWYGLDQWQRGYALLELAGAERKLGTRFRLAKASGLLNADHGDRDSPGQPRYRLELPAGPISTGQDHGTADAKRRAVFDGGAFFVVVNL